MDKIIDIAADGDNPAVLLENKEMGDIMDRLMALATTPSERALVRALDKLLDEMWQFATNKSLRARLRKLWEEQGRHNSNTAYYRAFNSMREKII